MDFSKYEPHAEGSPAGVTLSSVPISTSSQIVHFLDANPAQTYSVDSEPDSSFSVAHTDDANLEKFFERPIIVYIDTWNQSVNYYNFFNPWAVFFNDKRVVNRIANYRLLKAKLHVKAVINGNSFFYGRLLMNYKPFSTTDVFTRDRGLIPQDNVGASQRPHVYLDPTYSQGGQIDLPYFNNDNALDIVQANFDKMGEISIRTLIPLAHANGATDSVSITYLVWATEVELSIPTNYTPSSIQPQMAIDEYGSGPVSKPASVLAQAAGLLKSMPMIGPYARATELAAGALSKIAGIFGFSRPTSAEPITEVRLTYAGNMASSNLPDTSHKLTLDCKNEVTIDPRVTGLSGTDEMDIRSIAMRESFLTNFPWALSVAPAALLFTAKVTPLQFALNTGSTPTEVHMTPSCLVAMPFKYWRGSMKFRFQVVASSFHKGRLAIVYDPFAGRDSMPAFNTSYSYLVDISETRDFTITVGWGSPQPYLGTTSAGGSAFYPGQTGTLNYSTIGTLPFDVARANGTLSVYVLNELTVPNTSVTNDININVFTSMCDDFEVAVPIGNNIERYSHFNYQSLIEPHSDEEEHQVISPVDGEMGVQVANSIPETDPGSAIFFGESVRSIRQLAKRYVFQRFYALPNPVTGQQLQVFTTYVPPLYRGFSTYWNFFNDVNNEKVGTGTAPYAYSKMTFLSWFFPAFVGFRGSFRHKYVLSSTTRQSPGYFQASRSPFGAANGLTYTTPSVGSFYIISDIFPGCNSGADLQTLPNQSVLEVEFPYYSNNRFKYTRNPYHWREADAERSTLAFLATDSCVVSDYIAAGEDFSLMFFTHAPIMYYTGASNTALA